LQGNHSEEQQKIFDHLLTLNAFRNETRAFLEAHGLSAEICIDEGHWQSFLLGYSRVVEDCELVMEGANTLAEIGPEELAVESLSIRPSTPRKELPQNLPYAMDWVMAYKGGRRGRLLLSERRLLGAQLILE
jgi:hypothetical protein